MDSSFKHRDVKPSSELHNTRHVIEGIPGDQLIKEPESLLRV